MSTINPGGNPAHPEKDTATVSGTPLPDPQNDPVHQFLLESQNQKNDPVKLMLLIRDHVDSLDETAADFSVAEITEDTDVASQAFNERMFYLVGSWRSPFTKKRPSKWVNPKYKHRVRYSDVVTRCECGALMARAQQLYHDSPHDADNEHTEDCTRQQRYRAKADLCEARATALRQGLRHGHSARSMADRLGLQDSIGSAAAELGVDVQALKEDFKTRRRNTLARLLTKHSTKDAARVYGISDSYVREIISNQTPYNLSDLGDLREGQDDG